MKNVSLGTLREDIRYRADIKASSGRLTDPQLDRVLGLNLDRLMSIVSDAYGDDHFTFQVGIAMRQRVVVGAPEKIRKIPFSLAGLVDADIDPSVYWRVKGSPAPAFWRLRKLLTVETGLTATAGVVLPVTAANFDALAPATVIPIDSWEGERRNVRRLDVDRLDRREDRNFPAYRLTGDDSIWIEWDEKEILNLVFWYTGLPLDLADENAQSFLAPTWAEYLIQASLAIIEQRDRRDPAVAVNLRDQAEAAIVERARERDEWGPMILRDGGANGLSDQDRFDDSTRYGDDW